MSIAFGLLALVGINAAEQHAPSREEQWLYRETLGDGSVKATAVFLTYDYQQVAFTATCDRQRQELVLRFEWEGRPKAPRFEPLEISSSVETLKLRTEVVDGFIEGRTAVTDKLKSILRTNGDLLVFVPTEMGEPLHVGRAQPLRRVGLGCRP